ncbi:MAG: trigger factor [Sphingomonadales bacterium]|nr:trigger factor [Sphingomonadales bacterium]
MQIVETLNEGLKRGYTLTIKAKDIEARVEGEIRKVAPQMRMPGFRPGKVPANLVRKMHGEALQADALNSSIQDGVQSLVAKQKLRPAMSPSVELVDGYAHGKDAELKVELEVLPDVPTPKVDGLKLERLTVEADEAAIDASVLQLANQQKTYEDAPKGHKAALGDLVVIDFVGKIDGVEFDGGKGEGASIELGSGRMIPGFEEGMIGVTANQEKTITVTFPADYSVDYLKGKEATFDLVINDVRVAKEAKADDDFAKSLGLEGLEQLRGLFKGQIEQELNNLTRTHMKRRLLDQLASSHDFDVPPSMVEAEFEQIWKQLEHEASHDADPEAALKEMEAEKEDYRAIAVRRVRLGLLLSEIGREHKIEISSAEMSRLIQQAAQQYDPKDRQRFVEWVQQDAMASAQLRAPLYEDKVVDFLFSKAEITDRAVTRAELEAAIEADEDEGHVHGPGCGHDHHDHAPKAKKAAAKKPATAKEAEPAKAEKAAKPAAKKAAAPKAEALSPRRRLPRRRPLRKAIARRPAAQGKEINRNLPTMRLGVRG